MRPKFSFDSTRAFHGTIKAGQEPLSVEAQEAKTAFMTMKPEEKTAYLRTFVVEQRRAIGKQARNAPCACGSGKKFKKCCLTVPAVAGGVQ